MKAHIKSLDNLLQFREWIHTILANLKGYNSEYFKEYFSEHSVKERINARGASWFGEGITHEKLMGGITEYRDHDLLKRLFDEVSEGVSLDIKNMLKSKKMRYNANGLGMFSFDRAAMGFYRIKELYSTAHKRSVSHKDVYQKSGSFFLSEDHTPVIERWEETSEGKPKYRTNSKKLYAYFPKIEREHRGVEILVTSVGPVGMPAQNFLYNGVSAVIIARLLEEAKIKTKISAIFGTVSEQDLYACSIPIKHYSEPLDMNLVALLTSDPAILRFDGFKGILGAYEHFNAQCPQHFGVTINKATLKRAMSTVPSDDKSYKIFLGGSFSERQAVSDIKNAIEEIRDKFQSS